MTPTFAGRYRRLAEVNRGGMGRIEAAIDPVLGRRVAIKVLHPDLCEDVQVRIKFAEEAQIAGQLDHPNVVPVHDLGEDAEGPFIVMKLIRGKSLGQLLRESEKPPRGADQLQRYVQIVLKLCDALSFAHSRGVIHCDIKPDNVMVGDHGQVYLMDWGVALLLSRRAGAVEPGDAERDSFVRVSDITDVDSSGIKGTPAYMAPEQLLARNDEIDQRTDVFGLGGVLYEILYNRPPNDRRRLLGSALSEDCVPMPASSELWSQLPPELCRITAKALAPRREDRYGEIDGLRADLQQFVRGGGWFETRVLPAGSIIVSEGEPGDAAYIIEQGECQVFKTVGERKLPLRLLSAGDVFGETAVFTAGRRTASVVAKTEVTLKVITAESLNRELDQNPWLSSFVRSLAALFRETDAALSQRQPGDG